VNRRQFLQTAAAAGSALWLPSLATRRARAASPDLAAKATGTIATLEGMAGSILAEAPADGPIDTIVVLMMENRSFDHYFGWLGTDAEYLEQGRSRYGEGFSIDATNQQSFIDPDSGLAVPTYHLPSRTAEENPYRGCGHPDPGHGWDQGRAQRDRGFIARGSGNDEYALGYFLAEDLPFYTPMARAFTIFDHYHCSLMSGTYPNRTYLHSAYAGGQKDLDLPFDTLGFDWPTIWDRLLAAHVPCAYYGTDLPVTAFWGPRLLPITRPIAAFFADAAAGLLPRVVFLDPSFMSGFRTDDHPHGDMRVAQRFTKTLFRAFRESPHWGSGVFFITYDEWGGFFDHVTPPSLPDNDESSIDEENRGQTGFRVPTIMASPYAQPGFVDHRIYDHTSILRFIEWRWLGAPAEGPGADCDGWFLTRRDRFANNIGASLCQTAAADIHLDGLPEIPFESLPCQGQYFQDVPGLQQVEDAVLPGSSEHRISLPLVAARLRPSELPSEHTMEAAYAQGFFERMGYEVGPGALEVLGLK